MIMNSCEEQVFLRILTLCITYAIIYTICIVTMGIILYVRPSKIFAAILEMMVYFTVTIWVVYMAIRNKN